MGSRSYSLKHLLRSLVVGGAAVLVSAGAPFVSIGRAGDPPLPSQSLTAVQCAMDKVSIRGAFGQVAFQVAVADTAQTRATGLMFVEQMPRFAGMLFVYDRPQPVSFWMKNTLISLDMVFIDQGGTILRIHDRAVPGDLTAIPGGENIQYVLEINGGMAQALGLSVGDQVQHPEISQKNWPCL